MALESLTKWSVSLKKYDGTDSEGKSKYKNLSLPNMSENYYEEDKSDALDRAYAMATAIGPVLDNTISSVISKTESTISGV